MLKKVFLLMMASLLCCCLSFADELTKDELIQKLTQRVEQLEKKVEELNKKQGVYENISGSSEEVIQKKVEDALAKKEEQSGGLAKALKSITLSGFVDAAYTYNFNRLNSGTNTARVFDTEPNSFTLQAAKIALEKLPTPEDRVGFRTDVLFGQDAKIIKPYGWNTDDVNLEQAYADILFPPGKGLDVKAGKFVTLAGAEVIESKDNWNFSRSLLFGYAIPFTHTGLRASYPLMDNLTGFFGVNNGWDDIKDNNKGKSFETALAYTVSDKLSFNLTGIFGPEQPSNNHSNRALVDFVATYKPFEKITLKLNTDYGHEDDAVAPGKNGEWAGIAGYIRYDVNNWLSFSNRTEYFSDPQGLRVVAGTPQDLWENTLTTEVRPFKNIITRLEYRYDASSKDVFTKNETPIDHQSTIAAEAIYIF
ncbi:MAG: outer membrane beta-barrel protein [Candidatus Omnitrophica bacterium]|jgi:hypothetical protein|nr:outer membrane beta-barrel protein [Candidatus Omnitrophota bacterium]